MQQEFRLDKYFAVTATPEDVNPYWIDAFNYYTAIESLEFGDTEHKYTWYACPQHDDRRLHWIATECRTYWNGSRENTGWLGNKDLALCLKEMSRLLDLLRKVCAYPKDLADESRHTRVIKARPDDSVVFVLDNFERSGYAMQPYLYPSGVTKENTAVEFERKNQRSRTFLNLFMQHREYTELMQAMEQSNHSRVRFDAPTCTWHITAAPEDARKM